MPGRTSRKTSRNKTKSKTKTQQKGTEEITSTNQTQEITPTNDENAENISVKDLLSRIKNLESTVEALQSELIVVKNVNSKLSDELDDLHQYQRRSCLLIDGIKPAENENEDQIKEKVKNVLTRNLDFDEREFDKEFDKCHRVGRLVEGKQTTIVRFKSHRFKEAVYRKRKTTKNKEIKIKVSLTRTRTKTLNYAHDVVSENERAIHFAFADPNGNLKLRLRNAINGKTVIPFKNVDDLEKMISKYDWTSPGEESDDDDVSEEE